MIKIQLRVNLNATDAIVTTLGAQCAKVEVANQGRQVICTLLNDPRDSNRYVIPEALRKSAGAYRFELNQGQTEIFCTPKGEKIEASSADPARGFAQFRVPRGTDVVRLTFDPTTKRVNILELALLADPLRPFVSLDPVILFDDVTRGSLPLKLRHFVPALKVAMRNAERMAKGPAPAELYAASPEPRVKRAPAPPAGPQSLVVPTGVAELPQEVTVDIESGTVESPAPADEARSAALGIPEMLAEIKANTEVPVPAGGGSDEDDEPVPIC